MIGSQWCHEEVLSKMLQVIHEPTDQIDWTILFKQIFLRERAILGVQRYADLRSLFCL